MTKRGAKRSLSAQSAACPPWRAIRGSISFKYFFVSFVDFVRSRLVLFFLEHLDCVPGFVRRLLLVLESAFEVRFGKKIVRIKFEEA